MEQLSEYQAPKSLSTTISRRVNLLEARSVARNLRLYTALTILALIVVVPLSVSLKESLSESGFTSYISLISHDPVVIGTYFHELIMALVDSLPALTLALVILVLGTLVWSTIALAFYTVRKRRIIKS